MSYRGRPEEYWTHRNQEVEQISDKNEEVLKEKMEEEYLAAYNKFVNEVKSLYTEIAELQNKGDEISRSQIYNMKTYLKLWSQSKDAFEKLTDRQVNLLEKKEIEQYKKQYDKIEKDYKTKGKISSLPPDASNKFQNLDTDIVKQKIKETWIKDGSDFSDRIWKNNSDLVKKLNETLIDDIVTGKSYIRLCQDLMRDFSVTDYQAKRLVVTETRHINTIAHTDAYKDMGFVNGKIKGSADACDKCKDLIDKVLPLEEIRRKLPVHPNCRCTCVAVADAEYYNKTKETKENNATVSKKEELKAEIMSQYNAYLSWLENGKKGRLEGTHVVNPKTGEEEIHNWTNELNRVFKNGSEYASKWEKTDEYEFDEEGNVIVDKDGQPKHKYKLAGQTNLTKVDLANEFMLNDFEAWWEKVKDDPEKQTMEYWSGHVKLKVKDVVELKSNQSYNVYNVINIDEAQKTIEEKDGYQTTAMDEQFAENYVADELDNDEYLDFFYTNGQIDKTKLALVDDTRLTIIAGGNDPTTSSEAEKLLMIKNNMSSQEQLQALVESCKSMKDEIKSIIDEEFTKKETQYNVRIAIINYVADGKSNEEAAELAKNKGYSVSRQSIDQAMAALKKEGITRDILKTWREKYLKLRRYNCI